MTGRNKFPAGNKVKSFSDIYPPPKKSDMKKFSNSPFYGLTLDIVAKIVKLG